MKCRTLNTNDRPAWHEPGVTTTLAVTEEKEAVRQTGLFLAASHCLPNKTPCRRQSQRRPFQGSENSGPYSPHTPSLQPHIPLQPRVCPTTPGTPYDPVHTPNLGTLLVFPDIML